MKWIDVGDIKNWADGKQRHCQQTLPELVRRLILATAPSVEKINFPSGDSVVVGGWDGHLSANVVVPFFPNGVSGWEIGAGKSPGKKAEEDYKKRTKGTLSSQRKETTFVFVTPRSWPGGEKWQDKKRATGKWKDVRVINIDGLEQWLDSAPAVALWLARQIVKVVSAGIRDLEAVWEEWSVATNPKMTTNLVIGGRTRDVEDIQKWISREPRILEVQGDHPEEAYAFLYSAIAALSEVDRTRALARCLVVENINELRGLTQAFQNYPLIIAAPGECLNAAPAAVAKGHHVYISMDSKVVGVRDILRLSRPQRSAVEIKLRESGLSESEAQRLARDSGHSIPVLRRQLFRSGAVSAPAWANAESAQIIIPVLFIGAWDEGEKGDRQIIEILSGKNYDAFIKEISPFLSIEDSPIRKVGDVWMLKSPLDAWFLLAQHVTDSALKLFKKSVLAVLTETNPKYELPAEQRFAASLYGKSSHYSEWLRTGLSESLVLLAVYGNHSTHVASTQAFADSVIKEIFATAGKWEAWASLKDVTPLLAEAAPDTFMEVVEQGIKNNSKIFQELMQDDSGLFGECKHSGLLWALEAVAWSSEYFARAVNILSDLAKIDPGGNWSNRAINSLSDIFLPRFPQTYATPEERLAALDVLIIKNPQMVWEFGQGYFSLGSFSESHRFRWRDAGGTRRGLEPEDADNKRKYLTGLLPKLSDLACTKENLISTADKFMRLPSDIRKRLLKVLGEIDPAVFLKDERLKLLECIRKTLNWVSNHGDEERRREIPDLSRVLEKFTPRNVFERVGWILSNPWPKLPREMPKDYNEKAIAIKTAQAEAAREILDAASLEEIIEFAETVQYQGTFGYALGKAIRDDKEDASVLDVMLRHIEKPILIEGYALGRVEVAGPEWIDNQISRMKKQGNYSAEACALLYFGLPEGATAWLAVSAHGKDVENAYWKQASGYSRSNENKDAPIAVEKLLDVKRPDAALQIAGNSDVSVPTVLLQRLLQELSLMDEKWKCPNGMAEYHIGHIFRQLYEQNELSIEEIARLEWPFAPFFDEIKREISAPFALHRLLQKDPLFFAQLISFMYKRDDRAPDPSREGLDEIIVNNRAILARNVIDSWHLLPGLKDDGTLDEKELTSWVEVARKQCVETNHVTSGDIHIAFILSHAPEDSDGAWPHVAVRNLIERLNNSLIDEHIQAGIYNSRGVTSRGLNDGGKQERELVKRYKNMSDAVKARWPRTGAMLRSIAESYERQAMREDIDSELHDLRWD
ncbi:MAG: hypothetical protein PHH60_00690 [Candidatus Margulisbacteria bacterium]|nr:hypothetical protein [Candidatus Margulisiibacteriota bacterium]